MTPGALRLSVPREELPSQPIGEFESCRSSWLSLLSPLICPSSSSRSGLLPLFAREWLFYIGTVRVRRSWRHFVIHARVGRGIINWNYSKHTNTKRNTQFARASPCEVRERIEIHASYGCPWSRTAARFADQTSNTLIIYDAGPSFRVTPRVYCPAVLPVN